MGRPRKNAAPEINQEATVEVAATETISSAIEETTSTEIQSNYPKNFDVTKKWRRDEDGLLPDVEYAFNEDGSVNWRKMIKKEFLVPNAQRFDSNLDLKTLNVDDLKDYQLLILLGGIKELATLRGFTRVTYEVLESSDRYVSTKCGISWIPNYETGGEPVYFEGLADAHLENTQSFARDYLMAIAENRAFTRAVRNFLRINIVGSDEVGDPKKFNKTNSEASPSSSKPVSLLIDTMNKANLSFDTLQKKLIKEGSEDAHAWTKVEDIPSTTIFELITRIKKKLEAVG
jgi:hypothetical protein